MILYTVNTITGFSFFLNESGLVDGNFTKLVRRDQTTASGETVTVTNISGNFYYAQFTPTTALAHYEVLLQKTGSTIAIAESFLDKKLISDAIDDAVIETNGSITRQQAESIILSALAGVTSASGATFKDPSGASTRITGAVNASDERTAITLTPSS
jgi:hypothetical protein